MRNTAFLTFDYRNMSDIFAENSVGLQTVHHVIKFHRDASNQIGTVTPWLHWSPFVRK